MHTNNPVLCPTTALLSVQFRPMSLARMAVNLHPISTPKFSISLNFTRFRSTTATNPSFLEARARVKEHARNISRSSARNALVTPTDRPTPMSPPKTNIPNPSAALPTHRDTALDHSFVGMSGGQIFHEMIRRHDVEQIFGYPGGPILPVIDAIRDSKYLKFVLPRHEQGAGHMAEGYARVSGKPGVVLVTSGPGATNVVTPMQDALSDGVPLVVFSGQVETSAIGTDAFQETDIVGISRSCTKWNVMVKDVAELPRRINEAFKIATSGRPGPVLLDLPKDVSVDILRKPLPFKETTPGYTLDLPSNPLLSSLHSSSEHELIYQAAQLINQAERPLIYAGHGVLGNPLGPEFLTQLARDANIPVTTTLLGLGAFDETDSKSLHMVGMTGSAYANIAMQQADVIIALGARFDDRVTGNVPEFAPAARAAAAQGRGGFVHFEIQRNNINKVVDASIPILGDVTKNLRAMLPLIKYSERASWFQDISEWKEKYPFFYVKSNPEKGEKMKPQEAIEELDRQVALYKEDVIITTGVGQHQMWAAQHFRWRYPRSMISSGGLGTMGFGLPSALGAKVAAPNKTVVDIDGDASFSMTAMELATASQFNIGVKVMVMNDGYQGMVTQWEDMFYNSRHLHSRMINPDFVQLARSMGVHAIRVSSASELPEKMKAFLEYDGSRPVLLDCVIESHQHLYPLVPPGKALDKQILHPALRVNKEERKAFVTC